jgi:hypothetical protein
VVVRALAEHGATAAVARIGGGPQAFVELTAPLVAPSIVAFPGTLRRRPPTPSTYNSSRRCICWNMIQPGIIGSQ